MTQFLVDSHCHLADADFDADRDAVIERARAAGVQSFVVIGTGASFSDIGKAVNLAEQHEGAYAAAGIHPHEARHFLWSDLNELRQFARHPKFLGLGEIGLDYHYDHSLREVQQEILIRQLSLARELKLPIIIHCREAWADLRAILREHWRPAGLGGILHCFSGTREDAYELMDLGFRASFAGNVTFKKAENLRKIAQELPLDRLLTETDSPYLAPVPYRGKRNEPAYVVEVLRQLAALQGLSEEEMGARVMENFKSFFKLER